MNNNAKLPASCIDCNVKLSTRNRASSSTNTSGTSYPGADDLCVKCMEYSAYENSHNDDGHTPDDADPGCPVCIKLFNMGDVSVHILHTPERKNRSHAACTHESTPKARATCRKARVMNNNNLPGIV